MNHGCPTGHRRRARTLDRSLAILAVAVLSFGALAGLVATSTIAVLPAGAATGPDWPTFLQNSSRTAATTDPNLTTANAALLTRKWSFQAGGPIATSVSVVGTTAYVGSWDGFEYAVNTTSGALIWKQNLGQTVDPACQPSRIGITSSPTIVSGTLYVGGGDAYWYALDASTGAVLWKVYTGDNSQTGAHYNWSSPLIVNGFAYIGVASNCDVPLVQGQLLKVDLTTHLIVATHNFVPDGQVGGGIWTTPTYDGSTNRIFVSTGTLNAYTQTESQAIVALDAGTLAVQDRWQLPFAAATLDSDWGTTPTLMSDASGDRLLAVANKNGVVYGFNRNNLGAGPIWQQQIAIGGACPTCGDGTIASGAYNNNVLYYAGGHANVNGVGSGGSISALDSATGKVLWVHQTDGPIFGSPAYVNGMIAEAADSTFELVDARTGALLYSYQLGGAAYGAVSFAQNQFYVGAVDGKLYAFGPGAAPPAPPSDPRCPSTFTCQDVGNPLAGSESTANGVLTVTASGTGLVGAADQLRMITKSVTGNSQTSVRVTAQSAQNQQADAGIMVRQRYGGGTERGAPFYAVVAHPNDLAGGLPQPVVKIVYRTSFGSTPVQLATVYPANKPIYLMIQRRGNLLSAATSTNGTTYRLVAGSTVAIDFPATTFQGLVVDSGTPTTRSTASFTNLASASGTPTTMAPPPPAHPCPSPWTCTDLGNPSPVGDTTASGTSITLAGAGTGFGAATDSAHIVYQSVTGNRTLSARITASTTPSTAQAGLMMRASAAPTAPMYSAYVAADGTATVKWRVYDGVEDIQRVPLSGSASPAFLQIVRYQDTTLNPPHTLFSTLTSTDGISWTPVLGSTIAIDMGTGAYLVGLAATTGTPGATSTAAFDAVTLGVPTTAPPGICPSDFTCADIGAVNAFPGNQTYLGGTWTLRASGSDIWDAFDSFRFAYQNFPEDPANSQNGDGTISARVVSQSNPGGPWMKSGVMIRSGTDGGAPYYGVFVTPEHGVTVQWRTAQGAFTSNDFGPSATVPLWVLASRYTDTAHNVVYYSAYTSTDGTHFALVPGSTVALNLPGPLVAGIATDAYNSAILSDATFDNVAQLPGAAAPPGICPAAWACTDIGGALPPGQDQLVGSTWTDSAGGGDIWGNSDSFHLVAQTLAADGSVSARVLAQQATDPWAKAGVMLRASTDPGSSYYAVFVTPANGLTVQWRAAAGASTSNLVVAGQTPAFLRVVRYTTSGPSPQTWLTAYTSTEGTTWSAVPGSSVSFVLTGPLLAGFAVTSHAQGTPGAVSLDSVAITPEETAPPTICPQSWNCADIGGPTPTGAQTLSSGTWTIQAGGGDIWDVADAFHYVWQNLGGDATVSARVESQTNTSEWAKAGVMVRATTDPGSPYYGVFVTPANGVAVQWRTAQGATTSNLSMPGGTPRYVRVTRTGQLLSAATSADGVQWESIPNSSTNIASLGGALLGGLAATSHNTAALSTVVMSSVVTTP